MVEAAGGLCGPCWRETPFAVGLCCDACGVPLPGDADQAVHCDDCMAAPRSWDRGRAALIYRDTARRLVLSFKHGDRLDIAAPAAEWMRRAAAPILRPGQVVVPVPTHWRRLLKRRYNQAALLAGHVARGTGGMLASRALVRHRSTPTQDGRTRADRFANVESAIRAHWRHGAALEGADVLLIDDVMASGATLGAAALACRAAGAARVDVLTLARAARDI